LLGLLTGSIAGLATITPCAGYVTVPTSALIGIIAGVVCYGAINMKNKMGWDDALDVWGVHGVGGTLGIVLLGLFATTTVNANGADGLFFGNPAFFGKQVAAVIGASLYALLFSYFALVLINRITPVRTTEQEEIDGLDSTLHGEEAYI
jgi:ammonium transporter, Amt family